MGRSPSGYPENIHLLRNNNSGDDAVGSISALIPRSRIVYLPEAVGYGGGGTEFFVRLGKSRDDFESLLDTAQPLVPASVRLNSFPTRMTNEPRVFPKPKNDRPKPTASAILGDGSIVEMLFQPEKHQTLLCAMKNGEIRCLSDIVDNGERLVPYSPGNNLLAHEVVLFPSEPLEYESETELISEIQAFIHAHVDVSPLFEKIASYYILFSWVYDSFNELPYLRVRGDTGSGKTRCLLTVGALCYKPIFASGASTVSPIFRILDSFRGTLIVDEGDFRFSDEKADIVKILNNGNARGFPVLRSESVSGKEFDPRAYAVFGPKMIATRSYFEDRALESRCLTEETGGRTLRSDIPLNLDADWKLQAKGIAEQAPNVSFSQLWQAPH